MCWRILYRNGYKWDGVNSKYMQIEFSGRNMAKEVNWKSLICVWENSLCIEKVVYKFYVTKTRDEKWDICIYERHKRKRTTFGSESKQSVYGVWNLKHKRNGKQVWIQSEQRFRLKSFSALKANISVWITNKYTRMKNMESFRKIATTTAIIFLLWSIRTYRCTEGFKPGEWRGSLFHYSVTFNGFSRCHSDLDKFLSLARQCVEHTLKQGTLMSCHIFSALWYYNIRAAEREKELKSRITTCLRIKK